MMPLSCYILTKNSERYLARTLAPMRDTLDDLVIVDSGSADRTAEIAAQFGARLIVRPFDNFRDQRRFALDACRYDWVLSLDSDEAPDGAFAGAIAELKARDFRVGEAAPDIFKITRRWFVLGQEIHAFYPIVSPDHPARLFRRDRVTFRDGGRMVHETPTGATSTPAALIGGTVFHYSVDTIEELYAKLHLYTTLAAHDMRERGKTGRWVDILLHPAFAWARWYLLKGGWRDGWIGLMLGRYAYDYTYQKYLKLRYDCAQKS